MESNDRLNLQNDKDIEKIIPFDVGTDLPLRLTPISLIEPLLFSDKV